MHGGEVAISGGAVPGPMLRSSVEGTALSTCWKAPLYSTASWPLLLMEFRWGTYR